MMLFTTILGYVLHNNDQLRKDLVDGALGSFPIIGPQLQSQIHGLSGSVFAVVVGGVLLLYGAIGLGLATQSAMNKVWNIPYVDWPSFPLRYLRGLAVLVLLAASTVGSTLLTGFATAGISRRGFEGAPAGRFPCVELRADLAGVHGHDGREVEMA